MVRQIRRNETYKMDYTILTNPTEAELVIAVHENLYALFRSMQILPLSEVAERDKISYHHAFPINPMFKGAWRTRLPAEEAEAMIDETLAPSKIGVYVMEKD
jgi:hypothetical protein